MAMAATSALADFHNVRHDLGDATGSAQQYDFRIQGFKGTSQELTMIEGNIDDVAKFLTRGTVDAQKSAPFHEVEAKQLLNDLINFGHELNNANQLLISKKASVDKIKDGAKGVHQHLSALQSSVGGFGAGVIDKVPDADKTRYQTATEAIINDLGRTIKTFNS